MIPTGIVTPVQPSCVKPWMVPNRDPFNRAWSPGTPCNPFVTQRDGTIVHPGVLLNATTNGVIGESFNLFADCKPDNCAGCCNLPERRER